MPWQPKAAITRGLIILQHFKVVVPPYYIVLIHPDRFTPAFSAVREVAHEL